MKNIITKYIKYTLVAAAFALTLVLSAPAMAAPQFSAGTGVHPGLVGVQGCGPNASGCSGSPSAYSQNISGVQPDGTIWVMLYYNNTGTGTATNAKFTLSPQSTGSVSSVTFNGTLTAGNGTPTMSGSATANLAQAQSIGFLSAKIYGHNSQLITSTTDANQLSNGLNIGDVKDSSDCPSSDIYCHQGVVIVSYKVGTSPVIPTQTCQITNLTANPQFVTSGGSSTIIWSTSGCATATIQGGNMYVTSLSGSQNTGSLQGSTTYTLTAYGTNGSPVSQSITVSVNNQQSCFVSNFSANQNYVSYGGTTTLTWNTSGATSVSISGLTGNYNYNQSLSGSVQTGPIYGSQTYTLTANCQNGQTQVQSVTVQTQNNNYCSINSFYASPTQVASGSSSTLYWTTTGATSVSISGLNNYYNQSLSGSASTGAIYGSQSYTLTAYCQNGGQTQVQSLTVGTSAPAQTTQVFTGAPSLVSQNSARLNGNLSQSGGLSTQVYFQWGTSQNYGFTTAAQNAGSVTSTPFFNTITGLTANTVYHYRAVATNSSGTFYGDDQSFSTLPPTAIVPPTVVTVVAGVGSGSNLIALAINDNQQINACVGNMLNYLVTYKNISGRTLNNVVLQVLLPEDVEFQSSNPGIYNAADHTVTLAIGTLIKDQAGSMNINGLVLRSAVNRNLIVATSTIAFTNPVNGSQESATAYGLGNTTNCNSLAGLALFGNGFWPTTLIGWLILLLVLLLLIYLAVVLRRNYRRPVAYVAPNGYNAQANMNNGMRNQNMNTAPQAPHYEDMDVPVYNNNH